MLRKFVAAEISPSVALKRQGLGFAHRLLSSSFCGLYLESYKVIPKRNYLENAETT